MSLEREGACLRVRGLTEGESASSSPEASLEEGCCSSTAEDLNRSDAEVRFRFPEPVDDGEDMVMFEHELHQKSISNLELLAFGSISDTKREMGGRGRTRCIRRMRSDHTSGAKREY